MKKEFSKAWKASKRPNKQRKYKANAPLHLKRKMLGTNLSKDLRKKYGRRSIVVRKNDKVKILRGKFKGKAGKITEVFTKQGKVYVDTAQTKKQEGSKVNVKLNPSNLMITELDLSDKKRIKKVQVIETKEVKKQEKPEDNKEKTK